MPTDWLTDWLAGGFKVSSVGCSSLSLSVAFFQMDVTAETTQTHLQTHTGGISAAFGIQIIHSNTFSECVTTAFYCAFSSKMLLSFRWQTWNDLLFLELQKNVLFQINALTKSLARESKSWKLFTVRDKN